MKWPQEELRCIFIFRLSLFEENVLPRGEKKLVSTELKHLNLPGDERHSLQS